MAEGGSDDENRFSFNSFGKHNDSDKHEENEFAADTDPDIGVNRKRENGLIANEEIEKLTNRRDDNPFSFRQFLKKDHSGVPKKIYSNDQNGDVIAGPSRPFQNNSAPDFTSDLPDFVQGHYKLDGFHVESTATNDAEALPDFTLDNSARGKLKDSKKNTRKRLNVAFETGDNHNGAQSDLTVTNSLPDFLSDGPMLSNVCDRLKTVDLQSSKKCTVKPARDTRVRVSSKDSVENLLKSDNERLLRELDKTRELLRRESLRVKELGQELESLKYKDKEEAVTLELMVQQVETNMQGTTERASIAEGTISKLKLEIKTLQKQLTTVSRENELLRNCDAKRCHKTKHAAKQMSSAAENAHHHLMQLISGVDSLKLMAAFLTDIDKSPDHAPSENT